MTAYKKFLLALGMIITLIFSGVFGYMTIEDWTYLDSLYMTFVTISTVGFGEVHTLSDTGRYFTIALILVSLGVIGYTISTLISFLFEGQLLDTMRERRMKQSLLSIKDHFIICGFGSVGKETANELNRRKIPFVLVDWDYTDGDKESFPNYIMLDGDAADEAMLEKAKIQKARGLICCLPQDQQNVFTVLTARQMNPSLQIVSRANEVRSISKLEKAGANRVLMPNQIAGKRLATLSIRPTVMRFLDEISSGDSHDLNIDSVKIIEHSNLIGKSLKESNIGQHTGAIIIGILDSNGKLRSNKSNKSTVGAIMLEEHDELIAMGSEDQLKSLKKFTSMTRSE